MGHVVQKANVLYSEQNSGRGFKKPGDRIALLGPRPGSASSNSVLDYAAEPSCDLCSKEESHRERVSTTSHFWSFISSQEAALITSTPGPARLRRNATRGQAQSLKPDCRGLLQNPHATLQYRRLLGLVSGHLSNL